MPWRNSVDWAFSVILNLMCSLILLSDGSPQGPIPKDASKKRFFFYSIVPTGLLFCVVLFVGSAFVTFDVGSSSVTFDHKENLSILQEQPNNLKIDQSNPPTSQLRDESNNESNKCKNQCKPSGSEPLPRGIVKEKTNLELEPLWGSPERKEGDRPSKSLLAIPVGIKQKEVVNKLVSKFPAANFTVMLFHYDGVVDQWRDLKWCDSAIHISARDQTKWWFSKRFLHPDMVAEYDYIFLWDEDLEVDHFDPIRYLKIVKREGLEISQPALDHRSQIHHRITLRSRRGHVHRRFYKLTGGGRCYENSTAPPCTGWVEMMAPVFSRAAWRCSWHMIQNDLIYAWGLDYKLGYCAQGDRSLNVGVVDSEYVLHRGIPTLGDGSKVPSKPLSKDNDRYVVRRRSYAELQMFNKRWQEAVAQDECWTDPYPQQKTPRR